MSPKRRPRSADQMRLALQRPPSFDRAGFIASPTNQAALEAVEDWTHWPGGRLALVGPEGSGKTHLARIWAASVEADVIASDQAIPDVRGGEFLVLEDADRRPADEALFHALNAAETGGALLLTARATPRDWRAELPDLRSRLNALCVVQIAPPDDAVLRGLLDKFLRERNIRTSPEVLTYLVRRIERAAPTAREVATLIDDLAAAENREVTRALAKEVLDRLEPVPDLFGRGCDEAAPEPQERG